jgi:hypothetical protein
MTLKWTLELNLNFLKCQNQLKMIRILMEQHPHLPRIHILVPFSWRLKSPGWRTQSLLYRVLESRHE